MINFSFIIPVYNVEKYLERCINSILNQSYTNFEIILINDGSTDNSGIICDKYSELDSRIVVHHTENKGLSQARNSGIELASGKYIIFLDSDDYWIDDKLGEIATSCSIKNPDILVYNYDIYNMSSNKIITRKAIDFGGDIEGTISGEEYLDKILNKNPLYGWYAWLYVIRKDMLINSNLFFKIGIKYEDVDLIYKIILKAKRISIIDEVILRYIVGRSGSTTYKVNLYTEKDKLDVVRQNIKYIEGLNISDALKMKLNNNISCLFYSSLIICNEIKNKEQREELLEQLKSSIWVCKYTTNKSQKIVYHIIKMFGIKTTAKMLYIRKFIKDRM